MSGAHWERRQDDAEARMRARMARVERERAERRKRYTAAAVLSLVFALSLAYGLVARALRARPAGAEVAERPAPPAAPAAVPDASPSQAQPAPSASPATATAASVAGTKRAPQPAPTPAPARKLAPKPASRPAPKAVPTEHVRITIGAAGYEPSEVRVAAGARVTITVGKGEGCAAGFLMPDLGVDKDNSAGPVTFTVGPLKAGTYRFTCGMEMVEGRIIAG